MSPRSKTCRIYDWEIAWRALVLIIGIFLGAAIVSEFFGHVSLDPALQAFGMYIVILMTFHLTEFLVMAVANPSSVSPDSFLLNHSLEYWIAMCSSWFEFGIEYIFFRQWKTRLITGAYFYEFGLLMCLIGEAVRKSAMITAGSNFTHLIATRRKDDHQLITRGIYGIMRHPSYFGWFIWSIGTQLIVCNPLCCIAFAVASWRFFNERIYAEEMTLIRFFGKNYVRYKNQVPFSGVPFVEGIPVSSLSSFTRQPSLISEASDSD